MKSLQNSILLFILYISAITTVNAQNLISAEELAGIYDDENVQVIWAGSNEGYRIHIKGAINMPYNELCNHQPVKNLVKTPEEMAQILGSKGISSDKTLIVYDDGVGKYAARLYWTLKYLGVKNVKMLDGNLPAWKNINGYITVSPTKTNPVVFNAAVDKKQLATINDVKDAIGDASVIILDARPAEDFSGASEANSKNGHIPGAVNVDFENLKDENGLLKPKEDLKTIFEGVGVTPGKTIIIYCNSGVRASFVYLALKELNYPNLKVYDGSFLEWKLDANNKVEA
jgi:thiosulfate/3-mercaptopyruvate sulfurtransferase